MHVVSWSDSDFKKLTWDKIGLKNTTMEEPSINDVKLSPTIGGRWDLPKGGVTS